MKRLITYLFIAILCCTMSLADDLAKQITVLKKLNTVYIIRIAVYNILGQRTDYLVNNFQTQGYYSIRWDASRYPSGLYFITMEAGQFRETRKVLMIK